MKSLAYLTDIFEKLNGLDIKLQGKETNIIQLRDCLMAFCSKLQNLRRKIMQGNIAMFDNLSGLFQEHEVLNEPFKTSITQHLQTELTRYFPELKENEVLLARNPFSAVLDVTDIPDELQDQFYDL